MTAEDSTKELALWQVEVTKVQRRAAAAEEANEVGLALPGVRLVTWNILADN
jgi:hypothetical protein